MALEVDFITLGDASERLRIPEDKALGIPETRVPAPTLRHWTDQLEEFNVHFVLRNNRNERIYEESDIKVFEFLRDLKAEYGRRTTTKDLGYMLLDKGRAGDIKLRTREDVPVQPPSNRTSDLLNQEDVKQLLQSDRVRQVIGVIVAETTKNLKEDLIEEVRQSFREELLHSKSSIEVIMERAEENRAKKDEERYKKMEEAQRLRDEKNEEMLNALQQAKKELEDAEAQKPKTWIQKLMGQ